jgi:hypothetical protein
MNSRKFLKNMGILLVLLSILSLTVTTIIAENSGKTNIEIFPLKISPDQEVSITMDQIPADSLVNMTLNGTIKTTPGEELDYSINNFLFPYESGTSAFQVEMLNLEPGTLATVSFLRNDGTEASRSDNVSQEGRFSASVQGSITKEVYNITFIGIPASSEVKANIDFGGKAKVSASTSSVATESSFIPSGITDGAVGIKIYIDNQLQKEDTITISS